MHYEECIIVGGGPCGLAAAIRLKEIGINPLIIEKENIVHSIYRFPTHQTFSAQVIDWKLAVFLLLRKTANRLAIKLWHIIVKWSK